MTGLADLMMTWRHASIDSVYLSSIDTTPENRLPSHLFRNIYFVPPPAKQINLDHPKILPCISERVVLICVCIDIRGRKTIGPMD